MCRDQNWTSVTERATKRPTDQPSKRASERMKIEKPGVGQPLLGPAKIIVILHNVTDSLLTDQQTSGHCLMSVLLTKNVLKFCIYLWFLATVGDKMFGLKLSLCKFCDI